MAAARLQIEREMIFVWQCPGPTSKWLFRFEISSDANSFRMEGGKIGVSHLLTDRTGSAALLYGEV